MFIVGCEPDAACGEKNPEGMSMGLSAPVEGAVEEATNLVLEVAGRILAGLDPVATTKREERSLP